MSRRLREGWQAARHPAATPLSHTVRWKGLVVRMCAAATLALVMVVMACSGDSHCPAAPCDLPPCDLPPLITALPDTSVAVGDTLRLQIEAVDPEGEPLRYRLVIAWMPESGQTAAVLDSLSGAFVFIAAETDRPVRWFGFFARDPGGNESSMSIYVTVYQGVELAVGDVRARASGR